MADDEASRKISIYLFIVVVIFIAFITPGIMAVGIKLSDSNKKSEDIAPTPTMQNTSSQSPTFTTIAQGTNTSRETTSLTEELIRNQQDLKSVWKDLGQSVVPSINFSTESVVFIRLGTQRSGGYSVNIEKITEEGSAIYVDYTVTNPGQSCFVTMAQTSPYHAVIVRSTAKQVIFRTRTQTSQC